MGAIQRVTEEEEKEMISLFLQGISQGEIALQTNRDRATIRFILKKYGYAHTSRTNPSYKIEEWQGKKIGVWTVISLDPEPRKTKKEAYTWLCMCDCGTQRKFIPCQLFKSTSIRCQSCPLKPFDPWDNYLISLQKNAKKRNLVFEISKKDIENQFLLQNSVCALSGIKLIIRSKNKGAQTASLDRIESNIGYVKGNIQWIHKDINCMKWNYNQDYFISLCTKVVAHQC